MIFSYCICYFHSIKIVTAFDKITSNDCLHYFLLTPSSALSSDKDRCAASFAELHYLSDGLQSQCEMLKQINVNSYAECVQNTCEKGGNTINYLNGLCQIRKCEDSDYQVSNADEGWMIATLAGK